MIRYNKPYYTGNEVQYIKDAVERGRLSGNNLYTQKCHDFFNAKFGFSNCLLTTSCTDALEMCAILIDIKPGDEVIVPSYTFVSSCNPFILRGAKIVFADSEVDHPNMSVAHVETLITPKTKAIVAVHYSGVSCDMEGLLKLKKKYQIAIVEDAAHSIDSYFRGKPLGSIGDLSAFSFHETKNISCGEGGLLVINEPKYFKRAEIIWEKGTNRGAFFKGEVDKYNWVDIGSSFLPSDLSAAFLFAQLEKLDKIQVRRISIWNRYYKGLQHLAEAGHIRLPKLPGYATNNGHLFYLTTSDKNSRDKLLKFLNSKGINAIFHYIELHNSPYYRSYNEPIQLPNSEFFAKTLIRLPMYYELADSEIESIVNKISEFYNSEH